MKGTRRLLIGLTVVVAGAVVGTAFAVVSDPAPQALTREQVYRPGMSLTEVATLATGKPGQIAPPCPDEATAARLKTAGIPFGPCDLLPEEGAPVMLPDAAAEQRLQAAESEVVCPAAILGKGVDLKIQLPCGPGAALVSTGTVKVGRRMCARVSYTTAAGAAPRTDTLCEGDVPSAGGKAVEGPAAVEAHAKAHAQEEE
jgi:hypothetical protein